MSDEIPDTNESPAEAAPVPAKRTGWRKWVFGIAGAVVILPIVGLAVWTIVALNWSYSEGTRAGYLQKFSRKGWICKTWEGELQMINIPGAAPERWYFTVRDDSVAQVLSGLTGKQVSVTYGEHPGVPTSCFGDTRYFVDAVRLVGP